MTRTMRVELDPSRVSPSRAIRAAARGGSLLVLTGRLFDDLAAELGDHDAATRFLIAVATAAGAPVGVNFEAADGTSSTAIMAPRGWSEERLRGWIGGKRDELEAMFGEATIRGDA